MESLDNVFTQQTVIKIYLNILRLAVKSQLSTVNQQINMSTVSVNPPPPIRNFYPLTGQNNVNTFVEVSDKVFVLIKLYPLGQNIQKLMTWWLECSNHCSNGLQKCSIYCRTRSFEYILKFARPRWQT